jgi:hypothetical protein
MDALIVATFRRLSVRETERLRAAQGSAQPLRALWGIGLASSDARLVSEFTALAYRIPALQREVVAFIEQSRVIEAEVLTVAGPKSQTLPEGLALLGSSLALAVTREARLGISAGHDAALGVIEAYIAVAEPVPSD